MSAQLIHLDTMRPAQALFGRADEYPAFAERLTKGLVNFLADIEQAEREFRRLLTATDMSVAFGTREWDDFRADAETAMAGVTEAARQLRRKIETVR